MYANLNPSRRENPLFDAFSESMMTLDPDLRIQWANQKAGDLVSEEPENLEGRPCYQALRGRQAPCEECPVLETIRTGATEEIDKEAPSGLYQNIRSYPLYSQDGDLEGIGVMGLDISERKQREVQREENIRVLELIRDNMFDLVTITDLEGKIEYAGKPHEILGYELESFIGSNVLDFVHPEDRPFIKDELDTFLKLERDGYKVEYRALSKDDSWLWFETIGKIVNDEIFNAPKLLFSTRDVTERKHSEEQNRFLSTLIENIHDSVVVTDTNFQVTYINKSLEELYGYKLEEVKGLSAFSFHADPDAPGIQKELQETVNSGESYIGEGVKQRKDGSTFVCEFRVMPLKDDSGHIYAHVGIQRDVTERKQAEEALRRSKNYYRTLFETSGAAIFIVEEDTTISEVNSNFEELIGCSRELVNGQKSVLEYVQPEDIDIIKEYHSLRRSNPDAVPRQYEIRIKTSEGAKKDTCLSVDMIPGTRKSVGSVIDITDRKRTERILQARLRLMEYSFTHSFQEILTATVDEVEAITDSRVGFYHLLKPYLETVSRKVWSTRTLQVCSVPNEQALPDADKAGIWMDCVRTHQAVIHNDCGLLSHRTGLPQGHPQIVREMVVPVYKGNTIVAMLGVGNKPSDYTEADIEAASLLAQLAHDITERKQMEERLRELSVRDALTGLYNRNFFEEEMERLSDSRYSPVGIVVCDLDGLKFVNDTLGHQSGDQLLVKVADLLRQNFRNSDIIARIGGDEFAILFTETDWQMVEYMLQRLHQAVQEYNNADPEIPVSLSVGQAVGEKTGPDMYGLFREADNRMYRDKIQREGSVRSAILQALTMSMEARDFKTEGHCDRLQELCVALARELNFSQDFENDLRLLARFHDLGKVGIPDHILYKPVPLTQSEWTQMQQHCEIGHRIASSIPDLEPIADLILKHHERWDGQGYPTGASGRDIPMACRILAIVDAYDAMTSDRPYQEALSLEEAIAELRRCAGTQFDPELVERLIERVGQ